MRCPQFGRAIAGQVTVSEIVCHDDDDIGFLSGLQQEAGA